MHRYGPQALRPPRGQGPRAHSATARHAGQAHRDRRAQATTGVVCLHASASSGRQWHALRRSLADGYRVLSPDLYGPGTARRGHSGTHPTDQLTAQPSLIIAAARWLLAARAGTG